MTPEELRALDIEVAKARGYEVMCGSDRLWYLRQRIEGDILYCLTSASPDGAWCGVPKFTRSLDACAPLLDEMRAGVEEDDRVIIYIFDKSVQVVLNDFWNEENRFVITEIGKPSVALPISICRAYIAFKSAEVKA